MLHFYLRQELSEWNYLLILSWFPRTFEISVFFTSRFWCKFVSQPLKVYIIYIYGVDIFPASAGPQAPEPWSPSGQLCCRVLSSAVVTHCHNPALTRLPKPEWYALKYDRRICECQKCSFRDVRLGSVRCKLQSAGGRSVQCVQGWPGLLSPRLAPNQGGAASSLPSPLPPHLSLGCSAVLGDDSSKYLYGSVSPGREF